MVVKKSKGFARTGNTQRKNPFVTKGVKREARITKDVNRNGEEGGNRRVGFLGNEVTQEGISLSLNKKSRWRVMKQMEERVEKASLEKEESIYGEEVTKKSKKRKQKKKRKCSGDEGDSSKPLKEAVVHSVLMSNKKSCIAVYKIDNDNLTIQQRKNWRGEVNLDENVFDVTYHVESGEPSTTWPYNVHSMRHTSMVRDNRRVYHHKQRKQSFYSELITDGMHEYLSEADKETQNDMESLFFECAEDNKLEMEMGDVCDNEYDGNCGTNMVLRDFLPQTQFIKKNKNKSTKKSAKAKHVCCNFKELSDEQENNNVIYIEFDENQPYTQDTSDVPIQDEQPDSILITMDTAAKAKQNQKMFPFEKISEVESVVYTSSISREKLQVAYQGRYFEGQSNPRCFAVVCNTIPKRNETSQVCKDVIIAEEIYENKLDGTTKLKLKIFGNHKKIKHLFKNPAGCAGSFDNVVACLQQSEFTRISGPMEVSKAAVPMPIQKFTKWHVKTFNVEEAFSAVAEELFQNDDNDVVPTDSRMLCSFHVMSNQCGICLEPLVDENNAAMPQPGVLLNKCLHAFCRDCWRSYLKSRIKMLSQIVTCPAHGCESQVNLVMVLNIVEELEDANLLLRSVFEKLLLDEKSWEWCPGCERVAFCPGYHGPKLNVNISDLPVLQCHCAKTWCFACQDEEHWPATCEQAVYYRKSATKELKHIYDEHGNLYTTKIGIKNCPKCKTPINKSTGCNSMSCSRCRTNFCWNCLKIGYSHGGCKEVRLTDVVFTSLDICSGGSVMKKFARRALLCQVCRNGLARISMKLGLGRQSTNTSKTHPIGSKEALIKDVINNHIKICKFVESVALTGTTSSSKHHKKRLYLFLDAVDRLFNELSNALSQSHIEKIDLKEVKGISKQIQKTLETVKRFRQ